MECADEAGNISNITGGKNTPVFYMINLFFVLLVSFLKIHYLNSLDCALPIVAWNSMIVPQRK